MLSRTGWIQLTSLYATSVRPKPPHTRFLIYRLNLDPSTLFISPHHSAHLNFIPCEANSTIAEPSGTVASRYKFPGNRMADVFLYHRDV